MNNFNSIVGYDDIIKHLQSSIMSDKVSHAYIIDGPSGSGKKIISNAFAKTLQCSKKGINPCNECISCITFDSNNHPDIINIRPIKKKSIGIDDIRDNIQKDIEIKPFKYKYKIYIINDADKLTEQAQNALLKTIEESPKYAITILLCNNMNKILQTIISRCVVLKLKPISQDIIKKHLIEIEGVSEQKAQLCAIFGQGILGKAKELALSSEFIQMREKTIEIIEKLQNIDSIGAMYFYKELETYKDKIDQVLDIIYSWYRDLLIIKQLNDKLHVINKDKIDTLIKQSSYMELSLISKALDSIEEARQQIKKNGNFQLSIEIMLLNLRRIK